MVARSGKSTCYCVTIFYPNKPTDYHDVYPKFKFSECCCVLFFVTENLQQLSTELLSKIANVRENISQHFTEFLLAHPTTIQTSYSGHIQVTRLFIVCGGMVYFLIFPIIP